ncbi:MAG: hypothetical protein J2P36_00390 [Ktedonobacteraceae bacterium]|nr:hypothetical protein [Ktedonobacteraceae bacterium]
MTSIPAQKSATFLSIYFPLFFVARWIFLFQKRQSVQPRMATEDHLPLHYVLCQHSAFDSDRLPTEQVIAPTCLPLHREQKGILSYESGP